MTPPARQDLARARSRSEEILRDVQGELLRKGYDCAQEVCLRPMSDVASIRIGIARETDRRTQTVDLDITTGVHFPRLKALAEELRLPIAGSVAWTVTCHMRELASRGTWSFPPDQNPTAKVKEIADTVEREVVPALQRFVSYDSTIEALNANFPCLWPQKRLVIPLSYLAMGHRSDACEAVRKFRPERPSNAAQEEYAAFADYFMHRVCSQ